MPVLCHSPLRPSPQPGSVPDSTVALFWESWTISVGRKQPSTIPFSSVAALTRPGFSFTTFTASVIFSLPLLRPPGRMVIDSRPGSSFCFSAIFSE